MSYQDFIASTEQSLTYLSDNIYDMFINYITEKNSLNQIKLYKFGYWIVIYKRDSKDGFVLIRETTLGGLCRHLTNLQNL